MAGTLAFDRETLHQLLLAAPIHVLCFDEQLVCRYAAPAGGHFLDWEPPDLQGRALTDLFPQLDLLPAAARAVLAGGAAHQFEHVTFGTEAERQDSPWTLRLQRCVAKHRRTDEVAAVLLVLTCARCACAERCCRGSTAGRAGSLAVATGGYTPAAWGSTTLLERVRTKLTVIGGFAQLLRRRSRQLPPAALADVERINQAARELGELLERYEAAGDESHE
jgi:hypothetical protein